VRAWQIGSLGPALRRSGKALVKINPFIGGNKRSAFAVMSTFLAINGIEITAATEAIYAFIAECDAVNSFGFAQLLRWLRENTTPA